MCQWHVFKDPLIVYVSMVRDTISLLLADKKVTARGS